MKLKETSYCKGQAHCSTNDFNLAKAWSHCWEIKSSAPRASAIALGSNWNRFSRPCRTERMRPDSSSTRRCLVMACREIAAPSARRVMEKSDPPLSFSSSASRVSSPNAANKGACRRNFFWLSCEVLADMFLDVRHLGFPAARVHAKGLVAPSCWNGIETRLRKFEQSAGGNCLQSKLYQGRLLLRIVDCR